MTFEFKIERIDMNSEDIHHVAVIGSGTMGAGIALIFSIAGIEVSLFSRSDNTLESARLRIQDNLRLFVDMKILQKDKAEKAFRLIDYTTDMESACRKAQYVTETVPEIIEVKKQIFQQADQWCADNVILASCTSSMSIGEIGSFTQRPDRVIGTHWVKPAHIIQVVEIVLGPQTSQTTWQLTKALLERIGKITATCKDNPGHMHNAMQYALTKVAVDLYERGIASIEDIDTVVKHGFGFRMNLLGPIERYNLGPLHGSKRIWEHIDSQTGSLGPFPKLFQDVIDQGRRGLKDYSEEEVRIYANERDRKLLEYLKALGRIS